MRELIKWISATFFLFARRLEGRWLSKGPVRRASGARRKRCIIKNFFSKSANASKAHSFNARHTFVINFLSKIVHQSNIPGMWVPSECVPSVHKHPTVVHEWVVLNGYFRNAFQIFQHTRTHTHTSMNVWEKPRRIEKEIFSERDFPKESV